MLAGRPAAGATRDDLIEAYLREAHGDAYEHPDGGGGATGGRRAAPAAAEEEDRDAKRSRRAPKAAAVESDDAVSENEPADPAPPAKTPRAKGRKAAAAVVQEEEGGASEEAGPAPAPAKTPRGRSRRATPAPEAELAPAEEPAPSKTPRKKAGKAAAAAGPTASASCLSPGETVELDRCRFEVGAQLAAGADSTIFRGRCGRARAPRGICGRKRGRGLQDFLRGRGSVAFSSPLLPRMRLTADGRLCTGATRAGAPPASSRGRRWRSRCRRGSRRPCTRWRPSARPGVLDLPLPVSRGGRAAQRSSLQARPGATIKARRLGSRACRAGRAPGGRAARRDAHFGAGACPGPLCCAPINGARLLASHAPGQEQAHFAAGACPGR